MQEFALSVVDHHSVRMGKALLGLAMASVLLRSYIGLGPWKLALLLLSLFVLNLLQVSLRLGRGAARVSRRTVLPRSFDSAHAIASPCSSVSTHSQCSPNPTVRQSAPSESEAFSPVFRGEDAAGLKWDAELTRTPRSLRRVRTGHAYQPPASCTYQRRRAACRQGATFSACWERVPAFGVPHAPHTVVITPGGAWPRCRAGGRTWRTCTRPRASEAPPPPERTARVAMPTPRG